MTRLPESLPRQMIDAVPSPYPASFDGSTIRFWLALSSLMAMAIIGALVAGWMLKEIWQGRREALPHEPLFAMRLIFFLCALVAFIRSAPEAAMMITWRENPAAAATIMVAKRWIDSAAVVPALTWMALVFVFYPMICMKMVRIDREDRRRDSRELEIPLPNLRKRVTKLVRVSMIVFAIALCIALGKR